jgi:hypothetical protein
MRPSQCELELVENTAALQALATSGIALPIQSLRRRQPVEGTRTPKQKFGPDPYVGSESNLSIYAGVTTAQARGRRVPKGVGETLMSSASVCACRGRGERTGRGPDAGRGPGFYAGVLFCAP